MIGFITVKEDIQIKTYPMTEFIVKLSNLFLTENSKQNRLQYNMCLIPQHSVMKTNNSPKKLAKSTIIVINAKGEAC